jgi:hypothetical protein
MVRLLLGQVLGSVLTAPLNRRRSALSEIDITPFDFKRRRLEFVCSNSRWTADGLEVEFRQPFDMIAAAAAAQERKRPPEIPPAAVSKTGSSSLTLFESS